MSLAKAIRAGVAVADSILQKNDLLVPIGISNATGGLDEFGQRRFSAETTYRGLMEDVRGVRREKQRDVPVATHKVTIFETVTIHRGDRVSCPDAVRDCVKFEHQRDADGTYMTTLYLA